MRGRSINDDTREQLAEVVESAFAQAPQMYANGFVNGLNVTDSYVVLQLQRVIEYGDEWMPIAGRGWADAAIESAFRSSRGWPKRRAEE